MEWQVYRDSCKQHLADVVLQYVDCAETIVLTWGTMGISLEREVHSSYCWAGHQLPSPQSQEAIKRGRDRQREAGGCDEATGIEVE